MQQHLNGQTGNNEEQHKEMANVMAQIEVLGESLAKGKLKFASQKQEHSATMQHVKQEVAKLSELFASDSAAAKQADGDVEAFKTESASAHAEEKQQMLLKLQSCKPSEATPRRSRRRPRQKLRRPKRRSLQIWQIPLRARRQWKS
jgi:hypothetical protein